MLPFLCQYLYKNIRDPNGGLISVFLGALGGGAKIKKLIEKSQSSLTIKINCRKRDFKSHICIIQMYQKNKNSW